MPDVRVKVEQGHCTSVAKEVTIGTQGVGPCIAIIATLADGMVFCGHMDSATDEAKPAKVREILEAALPSPLKIKQLWFMCENTMPSSQCMVDTVKKMYEGCQPSDADPYHKNHGLYWDGNKIQKVKCGDSMERKGEQVPVLIQKFRV